jgi:membrane fusion protein (multidrug efflux system)
LYVIAGGKAKLQPVDIGMRTEDQVQILHGVNEGDVVATTNLLRIRPGLEVTAVSPP